MSDWSRTNRLIIAAAERLGVQAEAIASEHSDFFLRLTGPGGEPGAAGAVGASVIISKTRSPFLTEVAQTLTNNKWISRELLGRRGIPVVAGLLLDDAADPRVDLDARARARAWLTKHARVVVKPNWGNRGIGIVTDVTSLADLFAAYAFARAHDRDEEVLIEPWIAGVNVRVAVIGGRFAAAAEIARPRLRGDGRARILDLIAQLNADPRRGSWDRPGLEPLDQVEAELVAELLEPRGLALDSVLEPDAELELPFEELEVIDRSDALHPGWVDVAVTAAGLLGIDVAGVDLRGSADQLYAAGPGPDSLARLLEVNALPALHLHALPTVGQPRPVFEQFVGYCVQLPGAAKPCARVRV